MKAISCFVLTFLLLCHCVIGAPGSVDPTFAVRVDGEVSDVVVQPDGKILICGRFGHVNGIIRNGVARLFPDGSLDTNFFSTAIVDAPTSALALQNDGKVLIGGDFTSIGGLRRAHLARLNPDGTIDATFPVSAGVNSTVNAIVIQPDGKFLIGGTFTALQNGAARRSLVRFTADGVLDPDFNASTAISGFVSAIAVQGDGKILIGGTFTSAFGVVRNRIARLLPNGLIDFSYQDNMSGANALVRTIVLDANGKALVGGDFITFNNLSRQRLVRLNLDGSLDSTFVTSAGANNSVYSIVAQPDTDILIGGAFSSFRSTPRQRLARLFSDSQVDASFLAVQGAGAGGTVDKLILQPDGKILVAGAFLTYDSSQGYRYLARVYADLYPPEIIRQPIRKSVAVGSDVTFSVLVSNPLPVNYQWRKNGVDIPNANGSTFSLGNVQTGDSANYSVFISNGVGAVTSTNAALYVGLPPMITEQTHDVTVHAGEDAFFEVRASGTDLVYTWLRDGLLISQGTTNSTLVVTNATLFDEGIYQVIVHNPINSDASVPEVLRVLSKPLITTQPTAFDFEPDTVLLLEAKVLGDPPPQIQWLKDGVIVTTATNTTLVFAPTQVSDSGSYDIVASNEFGSVTGRIATINIKYRVPELLTQPQSKLALVGDRILFSLSASGSEPISWNWFRNDQMLTFTNAVLSIEHATLSDTGDYYVIVSNPGGTNRSVTAHIEVGLPPSITSQPANVSAPRGDTIQLAVGFETTHPATLQWRVNNNVIPNATNAILAITNLLPANIGNYSVTIENLFGSVTSTNGQVGIHGYDFAGWNGVVGYWPFTGNANDVAGTNNGIVHGASLSADYLDNPNSAYAFDGSAYIEIPNAPTLNPGTNDFTLSLWERADSAQTDAYIAAKYQILEPGGYGLGTEDFGLAYAFVWGSDWPNYIESRPKTTLSDGRWHPVAIVFEHGALQLYCDGLASAPSGGVIGNLSNSLPLLIGRSANGQNFTGFVDDVRLYNRALSASEIWDRIVRDTHLSAASGPVDVTVTNGATATFAITTPADSHAQFQWYKDGAILEGQTNSTLVISNASPRDIGAYRADIYNSFATTSSQYAKLFIVGAPFLEWSQLLAYFPFDGNAVDLGPLHLQATTANVTATTDRRGLAGGALLFDGATSDVAISDSAFQIGAEYTISLWFRSDDVTLQNQALFNTIPHNGLYLTFDHELWPGGVSARAGDGSTWISPHFGGIMTNFNNGAWHHLVFTKSGALYSTYIDGRPDASQYFAALRNVSGLESFRFGTTGGPEHLKGAIDEVRIFKRALGPDEALQLYNLESPLPSRINAAARISASEVVISFDTEPDASYSVFATDNLDAPVWIKIRDVEANSSAGSAEAHGSIAAESTQRFYRIVSPAQP